MNYNQTSLEHQKLIGELAADAFKDHRLARGRVDGMWTCRRPDSNMYGFAMFFVYGTVVVWGDVGEFVLCHSDANSLEWFTRDDEVSIGYYLGKLRALEGPKARFCFGDAMAYLDEMIEESLKDRDDDDQVTVESKLRLGEIGEVRAQMADVEHESAEEQAQAWHDAWSNAGDDDPPSCMSWTAGPRWLWEIKKLVTRLYAAHVAAEKLEADRMNAIARDS